MSIVRHILILVTLIAVSPAANAMPCPGDDKAEQQKQRSRQSENARESTKKLSGPEREAKRKEIKARLEKRLAELRARQTNGVLTAGEKRNLARCEQIYRRFEQSNSQREAIKPDKGTEKKGRTCERRQ